MWEVRVRKPARKSVLRAPRPERDRLLRALEEMEREPFTHRLAPQGRRLADFL